MERMYQQYKDIAEFRIVYIREAHATDSQRPVPYAFRLNIKNHTSFQARCKVAEKLFEDKKLTIPCIIDGLDNAVNKAYQAHPDRIYLVRKDGRLAIVADRGPWGFKPALDKTCTWLGSFKQSGKEPDL
jgi:hypothetical protein